MVFPQPIGPSRTAYPQVIHRISAVMAAVIRRYSTRYPQRLDSLSTEKAGSNPGRSSPFKERT
jgi:hypothetical protein